MHSPPGQRVVLLGHPVGHSISPRFQQAAFDHAGLPIHYEAWDMPEDGLPNAVERLRDAAFLGANFTIPHKQQALTLADVVVEDALLSGATNCFAKRDGRLVAFNTDVGGFRSALTQEGHHEVRGRRAVVFGAGGAARAVVLALALEGAAEILVLNRSLDRAVRLVERLQGKAPAIVRAGELRDNSLPDFGCFDLLVNCTSLGMAGGANASRSPVVEEAIPGSALVVDIVANPIWTPLLLQARRRGCATLGGLSMLVHQGALAFQLWTGIAAPVAVMMRAAREAMGLGNYP
ncbi:MAG: shikimate dehydrogenase [Dehalococcoidia bacterium]